MKLHKYEGKTVPVEGGTIPLRTSKNPVIGVFRHHCGNVATVHNNKGRKKHLVYMHCDRCRCDQASGEEYQQQVRDNMYPTLEALYAAESSQETVTDTVNQEVPETQETPELAVYSDAEPLEVVEVEPEVEQDKEMVSETVNQLLEQPQTKQVETQSKAANEGVQPKKLAICAGLGALLGGLFALAS